VGRNVLHAAVREGWTRSTPAGQRDRAILETFCSTGMRRSELVNLQLDGLNRDSQLITVGQGKGRRDRVVPIGERASEWIERRATSQKTSSALRLEGLCHGGMHCNPSSRWKSRLQFILRNAKSSDWLDLPTRSLPPKLMVGVKRSA
jgi:integrase